MFDGADNLGPDEYVWGVNIRTRDSRLASVLGPLEDSALPSGPKQGLFAMGQYLVLFCDGKAFWRDYASTGWTPIVGFQMSNTAPRFWAVAITGSSANLQRKLTAGTTTIANIARGLTLATSNGLPAALLVQDGVSQPWIIQLDLSCRVTNTYAQWTQETDQEYVPIGTEMAVVGQKLFILGLDGRSLYQSVSGRMLDFVVNVDTNGNKAGDASTTSHSISFEAVTGLKASSLTSFVVATARNTYMVELDFDNTVFGEPTFRNSPLFESGMTNSRSMIEMRGNYAFIDFNGIRSFNAVMNLKFEGQNDPFSLRIHDLMDRVMQTVEDTAAVNFDNYGIFSVRTAFGYALMIYDTLLEKWVSIDQHECIRIKNFATTNGASTTQLWALTTSGRVFQLFTGEALQSMIMTRRFQDANLNTEYKLREFVGQFEESPVAGSAVVIPYCDGRRFTARTRTLRDTSSAMLWPLEYPIEFSSTDKVDVQTFTFTSLPNVRNIQLNVSWTGGGFLNSLQLNTDMQTAAVSQEKQAAYANASNT